MKCRFKKLILCVCAVTVVSGFSAGATETAEGITGETVEETKADAETETTGEISTEAETETIEEVSTETAEETSEETGVKIQVKTTEESAEETTAVSLLTEAGEVDLINPSKDDTGLKGWFTGGSILKIAAGFAAGLVTALIVFAAGRCVSKKEKKKDKEPEMPGYVSAPQETEQIKELGPKETVVYKEMPLIQQAPSMPDASRGTIGTVHHIGNRKNQQDTFGVNLTNSGLLAIVSDGMGGLSSGDKVSQRAVMGMLQAGNQPGSSQFENPLFEMLAGVNEQVLEMLGPDLIYKSGATLLAAMVRTNQFHWIAVGDSRIYLYCSGHMFQLNREHIYKQQLLQEAVNQNISFSQVNADPQRDRLVSFLGMGELKYIDGSLRPVEVKKGDKLLLMSDGIFNTITEQEIMRILEETENAAAAAACMEKQIIGANNPRQDNFTCVILDF